MHRDGSLGGSGHVSDGCRPLLLDGLVLGVSGTDLGSRRSWLLVTIGATADLSFSVGGRSVGGSHGGLSAGGHRRRSILFICSDLSHIGRSTGAFERDGAGNSEDGKENGESHVCCGSIFFALSNTIIKSDRSELWA